MRAITAAVFSCLFLPIWGCGGCEVVPDTPDKHRVCGNGVAEGDEECDLTDLRSNICADLVTGSSGTLSCTAYCRFDTSGCRMCGDGVRNFGEGCDCGTDPLWLPHDCTDINGGPNANCDTHCQKLAYCGDGVVDTGEECDCGENPMNLPVGCDDINGGPNANCGSDCMAGACVGPGVWEDCNPLMTYPCCPDDWNVGLDCIAVGPNAVCARPCNSHSDCYWSNFCESSLGACWPEVCGPNWPNTELSNHCTVTGGGPGWCAP